MAFLVWLVLGDDLIGMLRPYLGTHAATVVPAGILATFLFILALIPPARKGASRVVVEPFDCQCKRDAAHYVGHMLMRAHIERRIRGGESILPIMQYALVGLAGPIAHGYIHGLRMNRRDPDIQEVKEKLAQADLMFEFDELMKEARSIMVSQPMEQAYRRLVGAGAKGQPGLLDVADDRGMLSGAYDSEKHFPFMDR